MDHGGAVGFEEEQLALWGFGAVEDHVVEVEALVDGLEGMGMPPGEPLVEVGHERRFLGPFPGALRHVCVDVVDHPVLGDRQVGGVGPSVDEDDPVLSEQAVGTAVVDVAGDVELGDGGGLQVGREAGRVLDLRQALAPVGPHGPGDDRELRGLGRKVLKPQPVHSGRGRQDQAG